MSLIRCERTGADGKAKSLPRLDLDRPAERSNCGAWLISGTQAPMPKARMARRQRIASSGRAAEMIELAVALTKCPDDVRAEATLVRIATQLLDTGSDTTIDHAIHSAHACSIAQTLRHAAEAASERLEIHRSDVDAELVLFAIPVLTTFEEDVPESQFETALGGITMSEEPPEVFVDQRLDFGRTMLAPTLLRLEELGAMPLSVVRAHATAIGKSPISQRTAWHLSIMPQGGLKRSPAFLRFVVGARLMERRDRLEDEPRLRERLEDRIARAFKRYLRSPCRVQVSRLSPFHEGLYSGMWLYQAKRLDQLTRASGAQARGKQMPEAHLLIHGPKYRFEMVLSFFVERDGVDGRAYRLRSRPAEDRQACVARIGRLLEAAGINALTVTEFPADEYTISPRVERNQAHRTIAIPI